VTRRRREEVRGGRRCRRKVEGGQGMGREVKPVDGKRKT
jgi:hypothetical protein